MFRFKDGSLLDETAVFSQQGHFVLITDHLIQKGPAFERRSRCRSIAPPDAWWCATRMMTGGRRSADERMELPADLANGLVLTLLKNITPDAPPLSLSMVAATPKPRLVKLEISAAGESGSRPAASPAPRRTMW